MIRWSNPRKKRNMFWIMWGGWQYGTWQMFGWQHGTYWVLPLFWRLQMSCRFVFLNPVPCCHPNICHPSLPKSSRYTCSDPHTVWVEGLLLSLMFGIVFVFESIYWHHHSLSKTRSQGKALWRLCGSGVWTLLTRSMYCIPQKFM